MCGSEGPGVGREEGGSDRSSRVVRACDSSIIGMRFASSSPKMKLALFVLQREKRKRRLRGATTERLSMQGVLRVRVRVLSCVCVCACVCMAQKATAAFRAPLAKPKRCAGALLISVAATS